VTSRSIRQSGVIVLFALICVAAAAPALAERRCAFDPVGTWKPESREAPSVIYRFDSDGKVAVLSRAGSDQTAEWREVGHGTYALDDPRTPKAIRLRIEAGGGVPSGDRSMTITAFDETSFTTADSSGSIEARWIRHETNRHFIVLAGRSGVFYDRSGPTFAMLIEMGREQMHVEAGGIYDAGGTPEFGAIPASTYREFMQESLRPSDVMLRLEITRAQYDRSLKVLRTWERRVREGTLLYPDISMDNILLVKQITEDLNRCSDTITLYTLDWGLEDVISEHNAPPNIPLQYVRELRRLNESRHVRDASMPKADAPRPPAR
jgi:hypothetical protein